MKKLFKYDLRYTSKLLLPAYICSFVIMAIIIALIWIDYIINNLNTTVNISSITGIFTAPAMALLIIAMLSFILIVQLIIAYCYYRNLYTDEGYLTFTLPVTPREILNSKLLVGSIHTVLSFIVITAQIFIIIITFPNEGGTVFLSALSTLIRSFDLNTSLLAAEMIISALIGMIASMMKIFLAITIGCQLAKRMKILASIASYFVISTIESVISTILAMFILIPLFFGYNYLEHLTMLASIVITAIIFVATYLINLNCMKRKINLP